MLSLILYRRLHIFGTTYGYVD